MENLKKQPNLGHRAVREIVAWRAAMSLTEGDGSGNLPPNAVLIREEGSES